VPKSVGLVYWAAAEKGMREAAAEEGVDCQFTGPETIDVARQISIMEGLISRRVAGIAIASNEEAARLSGINVDKVKTGVYALCGLLAGFAGVTTASHLSCAQPTSGLTNELDVIAAVIVGGTSLMGGSGTVVGTVIGAALMGVLRNGLILLGVSANWQLIPLGTVIIVAVVFDQLRQRRREHAQTRIQRN
jgi:ribose transport system permease protein